MGGAFCLCAMEVPAEKFEATVTKVNAHDEVAHNYEREHQLNMWFVLACETPEGIAQTAEAIEAETGMKVHQFPNCKSSISGSGWPHEHRRHRPRYIEATQAGLPLVSRALCRFSGSTGAE